MIGAAIAGKFSARVIVIHVLLRNTPLDKIGRLAESLKVPLETIESFRHSAPAVYDFGLAVPANVVRRFAPSGLVVAVGQRILDTEKEAICALGISDVTGVMADGDPADRILETAKQENADFIVMGRRGLGAVHGLLVGSVSTKVCSLAHATIVSVT